MYMNIALKEMEKTYHKKTTLHRQLQQRIGEQITTPLEASHPILQKHEWHNSKTNHKSHILRL